MAVDKLKHFAACLIIALVVGFALNLWWGLGISIGVGLAKEVYDNVSGKGVSDIKDAVADIVGAVVGAGIVGAINGFV